MHALADKIASALPSRARISLEVRSISSLQSAEASYIRNAITSELSGRGFRLVSEARAEAGIEATLSEGVNGFVLVAEIHRQGSSQIVMVPAPPAADAAASGRSVSLTLHRKMVWSQRDPFLDFLVIDAVPPQLPHMIVLERERTAYYRFDESHWILDRPQRISHTSPWPRDPRGLISSWASLEIHLPGEVCRIGTADIDSEEEAPEQFTLRCSSALGLHDGNEWPLIAGGEQRGDAPLRVDRNYFDGITTIYGFTEAKLPPFFSAAVMNTDDKSPWILAELDGKSRFYNKGDEPTAIFWGWGDDIVSLATGCGGTWNVLVTGTGDWTQSDHIQAYQIADHQATAAGQPLEFPGPILAFWPAERNESTRVVSRNLQTGMYEASIVSVSCSD